MIRTWCWGFSLLLTLLRTIRRAHLECAGWDKLEHDLAGPGGDVPRTAGDRWRRVGRRRSIWFALVAIALVSEPLAVMARSRWGQSAGEQLLW